MYTCVCDTCTQDPSCAHPDINAERFEREDNLIIPWTDPVSHLIMDGLDTLANEVSYGIPSKTLGGGGGGGRLNYFI